MELIERSIPQRDSTELIEHPIPQRDSTELIERPIVQRNGTELIERSINCVSKYYGIENSRMTCQFDFSIIDMPIIFGIENSRMTCQFDFSIIDMLFCCSGEASPEHVRLLHHFTKVTHSPFHQCTNALFRQFTFSPISPISPISPKAFILLYRLKQKS